MVTPDSAPAATANPRRWLILWLLAVAQLMLILDITVVAIALPHVGHELGLEREALTWMVSAYTLAFGGLMLLGGRLADVAGPRRIVLLGLALFTLASLAVGFAPDGAWAIGGRALQGVGAALLSPSALSWVVRLFDGAERGKALGIWSALGGGGAALGVLVGGVVTATAGWRWAFFLNVPIGLALLVALLLVLPHVRGLGGIRRLDVVGGLLVTAATGSLIWAIVRAGEPDGTVLDSVVAALVALLLYAAFVVRQRTAAAPLMDLRLLVRRPVLTGVFLIFMASALMIAVFFLGSFLFQDHFGFDPLVTGLLFLPIAIATMAGATLTGRLIPKVGLRTLGVVGLLVAAVGIGIAALSLTPVLVTIGVAIAAAGTGVLFVISSATALGQVAPEESGVASGLVSTSHEFGAASGAATMSSIAAASLLGGSTAGIGTALLSAAGAAVVAAVVTAVLIPRAAARS